jgi:2-oxoisovalerate dehydrogenase E1 component alpha subunit
VPGGRRTLRELYRTMALVRALSDDAVRLHRQGVFLGFAPCDGQEATQVGAAAALDPARDFVFQTYRDLGLAVTMGVPVAGLFAHYRGYGDGGVYDSAAAHVAPLNSVVGGTALHATGWAMGAKLDGTGGVALASFGDGASSQGEVHEAMNFAGVFGLPVIFLCQNNQWAISVPASAQIGGGSVAARAAGYGLAGVAVDGNDVLAVHDAALEAVERARSGGGATVLEALTYRLGPHATSDDPGRYRTVVEEEEWRARDPLARAREELEDEPFCAEVDAEVERELARVRAEIAAQSPPALADQLALAYERTPPSAEAQLRAWLADA